MKELAIYFINFYQKFISPYKGFSCAYRVGTGKISCSGYGKIVINRFGLVKGVLLLKRRFIDCSICNKELKRKIEKEKIDNFRFHNLQRGDIDCTGCDGLSDCSIGDSCHLPTCSPCDLLAIDKCVGDDCSIFEDCGFESKEENKEKREEKVLKDMEKFDNESLPKEIAPFSEEPILPSEESKD